MQGGYDDGYRACPCFWGNEPGRLVKLLQKSVNSFNNLNVLDAGCGEGKNAILFAREGAFVDAIDISSLAINNARNAWDDCSHINWIQSDIRELSLADSIYDIVVAYGLYHCFSSLEEVTFTVNNLQQATRDRGYHILCAFNDRNQDLSAHPGFKPLLLRHEQYLDFYSGWQIEYVSDEDLPEIHPHNAIFHTHSMTRIIARR